MVHSLYMQSNKVHKVFQWVSLSITYVSSTCFGPHLSIIRSVLYKLYSQIWYVVIRGLLDTSSRYKAVRRTISMFTVSLLFQTGESEGKKTLGRPTVSKCEEIIEVNSETFCYDDMIRVRISRNNSSGHVPYTGSSNVMFSVPWGRSDTTYSVFSYCMKYRNFPLNIFELSVIKLSLIVTCRNKYARFNSPLFQQWYLLILS